MEGLRGFNPWRDERSARSRGIPDRDRRTAVAARLRIINPLEAKWMAVRIRGGAGVEEDLLARAHRSAQFAWNAGHGRMIGVREIVHAPIEPGLEVILEMHGPAKKRVVAVRSTVPEFTFDSPVAWAAGVIRVRSVAAGPAAPGGLLRFAEAIGHEIEERWRVAFLAPVRRIGGIERAQRPVPGANVALDVEAAGGCSQRREAVIPALAVHRWLEGVHQNGKGRGECLGMFAIEVVGGQAQARLEFRVSGSVAFAPHAAQRALEVVGRRAVVGPPVGVPERPRVRLVDCGHDELDGGVGVVVAGDGALAKKLGSRVTAVVLD